MLAAKGVERRFDGDPVLDGVSLTIEPGEVVGIIGPSGVGKTTLLRLLAMFEPPDAGTVEYEGTDVWTVPEERRLAARRSVGMVFQEASLFDASVRRNVEYGLRVRRSWPARLRDGAAALLGLTGRGGAATTDDGARTAAGGDEGGTAAGGDEAGTAAGGARAGVAVDDRAGAAPGDGGERVGGDGRDRVAEALRLVGLEDRAGRDATSLSGGEAQRVAFARAFAYDPDALLLDEPTSDLDPRNTALIEEAIADARDGGIGVALATHDMHQARRIADRVALLLGDGVVEAGPTEAVFEAPTDDRTRRFINGDLVY